MASAFCRDQIVECRNRLRCGRFDAGEAGTFGIAGTVLLGQTCLNGIQRGFGTGDQVIEIGNLGSPR
jgi:hypothetical protein